MTYYAGFDVSMKTTSITIVNDKGKICFETICETAPEILNSVIHESGFSCEKIGIESGCLTSWLVDELQNLGLPAICIDSKQMATIRLSRSIKRIGMMLV